MPNDIKVRTHRFNTLKTLINKCEELFELPIFIVAQNWNEWELNNINTISSTITIYNYKNKLGITGARRYLRKHFLESNFDYLVMLDDDAVVLGEKQDALLYLQQIENHPDMYGIFKEQLLKFFAISQYMFEKIDYPSLEAEKGELFEDMYLIKALTKLYPNDVFRFKRYGLRELSNSSCDEYSTWYHKQFDKHMIGDKTRSKIRALK